MVLVRKLRTSLGADGKTRKGAVIEMPEKRAKVLIDKGLGELVTGAEAAQLTSRARAAAGALARPAAERPKAAADPLPDAGASPPPLGSQTGAGALSSSSAAAPAEGLRVLTRKRGRPPKAPSTSP